MGKRILFTHYLVVLLSLLFINQHSQAQIFDWAKQTGGFGLASGRGISTDANGNSYVIGEFRGTATFGSFQLTSELDFCGIFIAKYDNNGNCLWVKQAGGSGYDYGYGISTDANGNSYVTGSFNGTATFGSFQLTSAGHNIFIAKYDSNGNCLWANQSGGSGVDFSGYGISVDANGNSYVTGSFNRTVTFGSFQLSASGYDIFIAKYDDNGNCLWAKQAGGSGYDYGWGISTDANGNSYVTGEFNGTATFGSFQLTSFNRFSDFFIAKYDSNGNCLWVKQTGGNYEDYGRGISTDANGNSYVTGSFSGTATFGSFQLTSELTNAAPNIFIAKYDSNGNCLWAKQAGSTGGGDGISIDANGNSYVTGSFNRTATFGSFQLTSAGHNIFIAKYDNNGNCLWAKQAGGRDQMGFEAEQSHGISAGANGSCYVTGYFRDTVTFGPFQLTNADGFRSYNFFIVKLVAIDLTSPNGGEKWKAGSSKNITWASTAVSNAKVSYSTDNGASWNVITSSAPAFAQSYAWTAPDLTSSNCRIKIEDASDPILFDISDNIFTIWQPIVSSYTPTTGQITQTFESTNIDLSAYIVVADTITITYYPFEAPVSGTLPGGIFVNSPYYWHISSPSASIINGIVGVPISSLTGVSDATKLVWLMRSNSDGAWTNIGGTVSSGKLFSTVPFSSFSEFAIGTSDALNPLPVEIKNDVPVNYCLGQNYPNPFNPSTTIKYSLPYSARVNISIFNILGQRVAELVNREENAGYHEAYWSAFNLASGIYIYRIDARSAKGSYTSSRKMLLLK